MNITKIRLRKLKTPSFFVLKYLVLKGKTNFLVWNTNFLKQIEYRSIYWNNPMWIWSRVLNLYFVEMIKKHFLLIKEVPFVQDWKNLYIFCFLHWWLIYSLCSKSFWYKSPFWSFLFQFFNSSLLKTPFKKCWLWNNESFSSRRLPVQS